MKMKIETDNGGRRILIGTELIDVECVDEIYNDAIRRPEAGKDIR